MLREKRDTPQRAKRIGKSRKEREGKKSMSEANPYKFTNLKQHSTGQKGEHYRAQKQEVERHLWETHSDDRQWEDLGECEMIVAEPEILKKPRAVSEPGHNGLPCQVYKKCLKILKHLWRRLKVHNPS